MRYSRGMDIDRPVNEKCRIPACPNRAETFIAHKGIQKLEVCGLHAAIIRASKVLDKRNGKG